MPALVTTLQSVLTRADAYFEEGRHARARAAYERLLERAQERADRPMEVVARAMLARCHLLRRDPEAARGELDQAEAFLDPAHLASTRRLQAARARVGLAAAAPSEVGAQLRAYLTWAEGEGAHAEVIDACMLLADHDADPERWLQRAIAHGLEHEFDAPLGRVYSALAGRLEQEGRLERALEAYQQALHHHRCGGGTRQVVAVSWAAGAVACGLEDHPLARALLEEAVQEAEGADDCEDFLALALADLAEVHEAAGDVVEARRLVLRSSGLARAQDLPRAWPERWRRLLAHARRLELEI